MVYIIEGNPKALARPRWNGRTVYDSQKEYKLIIRVDLERQHDNRPLLKGALHLIAYFYMPIPKKSFKGFENKFHIGRPDIDNLLKMLCDCCNSIIFKDDAIICAITSIKRYSAYPRTEFYFEELNDKKES